MAAFKSALPHIPTGNTKADIQSLYECLYALVSELRTLLYTLDGENVLSAKTAQSLNGTIDETQLPETVSGISIADGSLTFYQNDELKAEIYVDSDGNLYIDTDSDIFVNGTGIG